MSSEPSKEPTNEPADDRERYRLKELARKQREQPQPPASP